MSAKPAYRTTTWRLLGVVTVFVTALLVAGSGVASAAPPHVKPVVDCHRVNDDGTHTLVLGYENTHHRTRNHAHGSENYLLPSRYQGLQPTSFEPGPHHGVLSLSLTGAELQDFRWDLGRYTVDSRTAASAAECVPSTPLPALGNGTGLAVALLAGGAFGVFFVRRIVRRAAAGRR